MCKLFVCNFLKVTKTNIEIEMKINLGLRFRVSQI